MGDQEREGVPPEAAARQTEGDEFVRAVVHDLRTPLVAIQGFVQLLESSAAREPLHEKQEEYLRRIKEAAADMKRRVEDLQTASQLERGELALQSGPVDLGDFMTGELIRHHQIGRSKEVTVVAEVPEVLPTVVFDRERVGRALGNLVEDAVRCSPEGAEVREGVCVDRDTIRFWVQDQGPGVDPAALPELFERRTRGSRQRDGADGSGAGLFIAHQIAALHGGGAKAENLPEDGCRLTLVIPLVRVAAGGEGPG